MDSRDREDDAEDAVWQAQRDHAYTFAESPEKRAVDTAPPGDLPYALSLEAIESVQRYDWDQSLGVPAPSADGLYVTYDAFVNAVETVEQRMWGVVGNAQIMHFESGEVDGREDGLHEAREAVLQVHTPYHGEEECSYCGEPWPCVSIRVIDALIEGKP